MNPLSPYNGKAYSGKIAPAYGSKAYNAAPYSLPSAGYKVPANIAPSHHKLPAYGKLAAPAYKAPLYGKPQAPAYGNYAGPGIGAGYGPGIGAGYGPGVGAGYGPGIGAGYGPGIGAGYGPGIGAGYGKNLGKVGNYASHPALNNAYGHNKSLPQ